MTPRSLPSKEDYSHRIHVPAVKIVVAAYMYGTATRNAVTAWKNYKVTQVEGRETNAYHSVSPNQSSGSEIKEQKIPQRIQSNGSRPCPAPEFRAICKPSVEMVLDRVCRRIRRDGGVENDAR